MSYSALNQKAFATWLVLVTAGTRVNGQITPRYTEVYASDTMRLWAPALSPDGRWIAFAGGTQAGDGMLIHVVSASGGTPVAVTHGTGSDGQPVWFPKADAILFRSSRIKGLMTVRIDPKTGRAIGDPERLTVESRPVQAFAISPDGQQVAIALRPAAGRATIKVLPARGGAARPVADVDGAVVQLYWRAGDSLQFMTVSPPAGQASVMRVGVSGGQPQPVAHYDETKGFALLGPQYTLRGAHVRINADTIGMVSVTTITGDTLARFDSKGSWLAGGLGNHLGPTNNPDVVLVASARPRTAVRFGTLDGNGSPREFRKVTDDPYRDVPVGFSPDSKSMYIVNSRGGKASLEIAPMGGGTSRVIPLGNGAREVYPTTTGRYAYLLAGHSRDSSRVLSVLDLKSGVSQNVSDHARFGLLNQPRGSDDFFFAETNGERIDVRHYVPGSGATAIASLDTGGLRLPRYQVSESFSTRGVAYARANGDTARLYTQRGTTAHLVATIRGAFDYVALSPDGHGLFFAATRAEGTSRRQVGQLVELDDDLQPRGAPRTVVTDVAGVDGTSWSPDSKTVVVGALTRSQADTVNTVEFISRPTGTVVRSVELPHQAANRETPFLWSKDNNHVFVLMANEPSETRMDVWRVGMAANERPASFVAREPDMIWDYVLSPDEKMIAYAAELPAHHAIWKVTLPGLSNQRK